MISVMDTYVFEFCEYVYSYDYVDIFLICGGIKSKGVAIAVESSLLYRVFISCMLSCARVAPFLYVLALLYVCACSLYLL